MNDKNQLEKAIFQCRQCGACCHGETTVSLDPEDQERMARHLKMDFEQVKERYLRQTGSVIQMKVIDGHCIFYNEGCTIHPGKPWRCSQWPLHPSILSDQANFDTIRKSCPGLGEGLDYQSFCEKFAALLARDAA